MKPKSMRPQDLTNQVEAEILASYESLYRLAYSYVKNPDDAMDVVQDSICKAMAHAEDIRNTDTIKGWLCRIVVHTALDQLRRRSREIPTDQLPEQVQEDHYADTDLHRLLEKLTDQEKTIIILRFFEDMRLQDIAAATGEKLNTVKSLLYRSLKKLKIELTEGETL